MLKLANILGAATDPAIADRLHHLSHRGTVEYLTLSQEDTHRHRLRAATDAGTECAVILDRAEHLYDGAVLMLTEERAVVVRMRETEWLTLAPRDTAAALELGYLVLVFINTSTSIRSTPPVTLCPACRSPKNTCADL